MNMKSAIDMITSHRPGSRLILAALALLIAVSASVATPGPVAAQTPPEVRVQFANSTYSVTEGSSVKVFLSLSGGAAAGGDDPDQR